MDGTERNGNERKKERLKNEKTLKKRKINRKCQKKQFTNQKERESCGLEIISVC